MQEQTWIAMTRVDSSSDYNLPHLSHRHFHLHRDSNPLALYHRRLPVVGPRSPANHHEDDRVDRSYCRDWPLPKHSTRIREVNLTEYAIIIETEQNDDVNEINRMIT